MALIFNEQFEATGYDETSAGIGGNWSETNSGGGTINEDKSVSDVETETGLTLDYWGDQCLELSGGTSEVSILNVFDSSYSTLYVRVDIVLADMTGTSGSAGNLFSLQNSSAGSCVAIYPYESSGEYRLYAKIENSGGDHYSDKFVLPDATPNTKYRFDIYYNGSGNCTVKKDGVEWLTGESDGGDAKRLFLGKGEVGASGIVTYFDNIQLATDGWIPEDESIIEGTTCWGHATEEEIDEDNIRTFTDNWTGTGEITGSGDSEAIELDAGEYMESEVVNTGAVDIELAINQYESGDSVTIKYRTSATSEMSGEWNTYSTAFTSSGYVQVRVEAPA